MMTSSNDIILYNSTSPLTFLGWIELQETVSADFNTNLKNYQRYIKEWSGVKNGKEIISEDFFSSLYIDLLKEITLNFVTEEERRFIVNFDYSKTDNLDIILPFFIEKIKALCLYYCNKRELLKRKITVLPYKGTTYSIKNIVKNIILDGIESGAAIKAGEGRVNFPSLSSINKNLDVVVDELYDESEYYNKKISDYSFNDFGKTEIEPELYNNFKSSVINAIRQYPLLIENLLAPFAINYSLSGTELNLLRGRDFINYVKTLSSEDLKLNLKKKLAPKYLSSDFYYLSVGETSSEVFSGLLFSTRPPSGANVQNLTNREYPTVAAIQNLDNLYTSYELGRFFIPSNTGILLYNTFSKKYSINVNKLTPNSYYVFPDPNILESEENSPIIYKIDLDWNKLGLESGFRFGDVISDSSYQRFYPYESFSQDVGVQPFGLSLAKDNVDFWNSDKDSVWTDEDLWPGLNELEKLPLKDRLESLLQDKGQLTQWYVDIYGNEFGLYKTPTNGNIFDKKKIDYGKLYVKNTYNGLVSSSSHFFKNTYLKYPAEVFKELISEDYISFYLIKNVFVIETKNYIVMDSFEFEFNTGKFLNTLLPGIYIPKHEINEKIEKFVNSFYVESTDKLYLCFLKLLPSLSSSNYKNIYPAIYELDINSLELKQRYPGLTYDISFHTLSSSKYDNYPEIDIRYIEGGKFSYKEKFNIFNLTYYAFNMNQIPFVVNEQFSLSDGSGDMVSYTPILNKPYFYTRDINFSNPLPDSNFRFTGNYSEPAGYNDLSNFNFDLLDSDFNNFHYVTKINPIFLNVPGNHYVHFNFDQYIYGNLFVGCENIRVTKIDNSNFVEFFTESNNTSSVRIQEDEKWFKIRDYKFNNYNFTLSAFRPKNTNNNVILFNINTSLTGFSGIFCKNLYSVYKNVKIEKKGSGIGLVTSDPFCVDCGNLCEFLYPEYGTLVLVPSAGYRSVFSGWLGGNCTGLAGNCFVTITDNTTITAVFNKIPEYTLSVTSNLPDTSVITLDNKITCGETCSAIYLEGEVAVVSASPAPVGFSFNGFLGSECGGNNPCNLLMSRNYSLTAQYLSSNTEISIYKNYNNNTVDTKIGAIIATINGIPNELITSNNNILAYNNGIYDQGSIVCSLSPSIQIEGFARFLVPRSQLINITATDSAFSVFKGYNGSPCQSSGSICSFFATENYSITGNFGSPVYTLNIFNSGSGLFYVQSEDNNIDCGNLSLINFKDKCFATYLSGTIITLSAISIGESRITILSSSNVGKRSTDLNVGEPSLVISFPITQNETITAVGRSDVQRTLTIIKSGSNTSTTGYLQSIIDIDEGSFSKKTVPAGIERETFLYPDSTSLTIYPSLIPDTNVYLYTVGASGLYYLYDVSAGLNISDTANPGQKPVLMYQHDTLTSNTFAISLDPTTGNAPFFNLEGSNLITIEGDNKAYITLNQSVTALVVFGELLYIAKEDNINDPIYTQSFQLIYK